MSDKYALPQSTKDEIQNAIERQINSDNNTQIKKKMICPFCQEQKFKMEKAYFIQLTQTNYHKLSTGGEKVAIAPFTCQNCGFIAFFSLKPLGLYKSD